MTFEERFEKAVRGSMILQGIGEFITYVAYAALWLSGLCFVVAGIVLFGSEVVVNYRAFLGAGIGAAIVAVGRAMMSKVRRKLGW